MPSDGTSTEATERILTSIWADANLPIRTHGDCIPVEDEHIAEGGTLRIARAEAAPTATPKAPTIPAYVSERNPHGTAYVQRLIERVDNGGPGVDGDGAA